MSTTIQDDVQTKKVFRQVLFPRDIVYFDFETYDEEEKTLQLTKLLSLVEKVLEDNGGQPYTDFLFKGFKDVAMNASTEKSKQELIEVTNQIQSPYDEQLKRMTGMEAAMVQQQEQAMNAIKEHIKELIELTEQIQSSYD